MVPADSTGNEGLDAPGIWRNGGLSYADHEVRAARGGDWEYRDDECVREEPADQARAADGLGQAAAWAAALGLRAVVWIGHLKVLLVCAK